MKLFVAMFAVMQLLSVDSFKVDTVQFGETTATPLIVIRNTGEVETALPYADAAELFWRNVVSLRRGAESLCREPETRDTWSVVQFSVVRLFDAVTVGTKGTVDFLKPLQPASKEFYLALGEHLRWRCAYWELTGNWEEHP